jgi:hypothetical protein
MIKFYTLDKDNKPVETDDSLGWVKSRGGDHHLAYNQYDAYLVSTIFLGMDLSYGFGEPLFFETMVFDGPEIIWSRRSATYEEALDNHGMGKGIADGLRQCREL